MNKKQETLLHTAIRKGFYDISQILVENNIDVMAVNEKGDDALCLASKLGKTREVELLLDKKERLNGYNQIVDKTALYYAVQKNHHDIVDMIVNKNYKKVLNILINKKYTTNEQKEALDYLDKKSLFLECLTKGTMGNLKKSRAKSIVEQKKKQEILEMLIERKNIKQFNLEK